MCNIWLLNVSVYALKHIPQLLVQSQPQNQDNWVLRCRIWHTHMNTVPPCDYLCAVSEAQLIEALFIMQALLSFLFHCILYFMPIYAFFRHRSRLSQALWKEQKGKKVKRGGEESERKEQEAEWVQYYPEQRWSCGLCNELSLFTGRPALWKRISDLNYGNVPLVGSIVLAYVHMCTCKNTAKVCFAGCV